MYALADWWRTSDETCPARIPRALWLLIILFTIPSFSIGAIAWVILRAVARAEARQRGEASEDPSLLGSVRERFKPTPPPAPASVAPDDDPEFLFRIERELARKRAEERAAEEKAERDRIVREREERRASSLGAAENTDAGHADTDDESQGHDATANEGDAQADPSAADGATSGHAADPEAPEDSSPSGH